MTEGGTLSKPIAGFLMQLGVWTSTLSKRFIDFSLEVLFPALDSLFNVDCYFRGAALQRLGVLMLLWLNFTVVPVLFTSHHDLIVFIFLMNDLNKCSFEYQHKYSRDNNCIMLSACFPFILPKVSVMKLT